MSFRDCFRGSPSPRRADLPIDYADTTPFAEIVKGLKFTQRFVVCRVSERPGELTLIDRFSRTCLLGNPISLRISALGDILANCLLQVTQSLTSSRNLGRYEVWASKTLWAAVRPLR